MNTLDLTKELIAIPSWAGKDCNEKEVAEYLYKYLKTFPWLEVIKQQFAEDRYNIIAKDKFPTNVMICNHIDTVQPQDGWKTNPFVPTVKNGKLYGLGATDTKGNIATILTAMKRVSPTKGLMLVLYGDEEYNFLGSRKFLEEYKNLKPKIIASGDGSDLELGNACRGLIEVVLTVKGQAGHASNPKSGINTITGTVNALAHAGEHLKQFQSADLGQVTTNLAWLTGGQKQADKEELGKEGNVIPNFAQLGFEIRNPSTALNGKKLVDIIKNELSKEKLTLTNFRIRHDLGAWKTDKSKIKEVAKLLPKVVYTKAATRGYVDLQMFWQTFGKVPCFTFGAGVGKTAHQANEYIELKSLEKAELFWAAFLKKFCSVQYNSNNGQTTNTQRL